MKNKNFTAYCLLAAIFFILGGMSETVHAQVQKITMEKLAKKAEFIVVGKVVNRHSEWNAEKTRIHTKVTISVDQFLKGNRSENSLTIMHPGGEVGEVGELYTHAPIFKNDEEVLLFISRDKKNNFRITGGRESKYTITRNELTGQKMVGRLKTLNDFTTQIIKYISNRPDK